MFRGKGVLGQSSLITIAIVGRIWAPRGVRSCCAKTEAKAERIEMAAMTINFTVGRR